MGQFLRCPTCQEVIRLGTSVCQYCSAEILHTTAQKAAEQFEQITQACASANNIKTMNAAAPILLLAYGGNALLEWIQPTRLFFIFLLPLAPLFTAIGWLMKYHRLQTDDADFQKAKQNVKIALLIWIPTVIVLLALVLLPQRS